ncbi:MAG: hypothetical protein KAX19_13990, partial [Candidatus Brocadiae bacterium]|nr:hypothetical protein [Candidatus Brocadiia bacterium]
RDGRRRVPTPEQAQGAFAHLVVRPAAVALLALLAALSLGELSELRGEMAFARFYRLLRLANISEGSGRPMELATAVQSACAEAELVMTFSRRNPEALRLIAAAYLSWSESPTLDPMLRLRLGEKAVAAAALAARAAPSDYETWLWLARAQTSIGLWEQAQVCLRRARTLAPPGMELRIYPEPA